MNLLNYVIYLDSLPSNHGREDCVIREINANVTTESYSLKTAALMWTDIVSYVTTSGWVWLGVGLLLLLGLIYHYLTATFNYWRHLGIPYVKPVVVFGSFKELLTFKTDMGRAYKKIYDQYKAKSYKYVGAYVGRNPVLIPIDPEMVKFIMTKESQNFIDRGNAPKLDHDYLQQHLFNMEGEEWREMRRKLSPVFTSGKMKRMFPLMEKCAWQLEEELGRLTQQGEAVLNCKDLIARFTSDIIASCAYGLDVNSILQRDNEFYKMTQIMFVSSRLRVWKKTFLNLFPKLFNALHLTITDTRIQKYLPELVKSTIAFREANNVTRNDFLDLLLKIRHNTTLDENIAKIHDSSNEKENGDLAKGLTLEEISSQTFVFLGAGFETAASTLTFCLYELSKRPDLQLRLRAEVLKVLDSTDNKITYEAIKQMTYMEQVINETLRLYASLPVITRRCVRPIQLPGTSLVVQPGVRVMIPVFALHHDPEYYHVPDTFDPDHFTETNVAKRHSYTHLPFGEGPRMCIGMRFGKMQVKVGLAALLPKFWFRLHSSTPESLPISPASSLTTPAVPVTLLVSRLSNEEI